MKSTYEYWEATCVNDCVVGFETTATGLSRDTKLCCQGNRCNADRAVVGALFSAAADDAAGDVGFMLTVVFSCWTVFWLVIFSSFT